MGRSKAILWNNYFILSVLPTTDICQLHRYHSLGPHSVQTDAVQDHFVILFLWCKCGFSISQVLEHSLCEQ